MKFPNLRHALTGFALLALAAPASAHLWQVGWDDNLDNTMTFYGVSYHSPHPTNDGFGGASISGVILNGVSFGWDPGSVVALSACGGAPGTSGTCDATWNALGLDGSIGSFGFGATNSYAKYASVTLTSGELATASIVGGTNAVTFGGFSNNQDWEVLSGGAQGTVVFTPQLVSAPEPATTAMLGLGLLGLGFARRRRRIV